MLNFLAASYRSKNLVSRRANDRSGFALGERSNFTIDRFRSSRSNSPVHDSSAEFGDIRQVRSYYSRRRREDSLRGDEGTGARIFRKVGEIFTVKGIQKDIIMSYFAWGEGW